MKTPVKICWTSSILFQSYCSSLVPNWHKFHAMAYTGLRWQFSVKFINCKYKLNWSGITCISSLVLLTLFQVCLISYHGGIYAYQDYIHTSYMAPVPVQRAERYTQGPRVTMVTQSAVPGGRAGGVGTDFQGHSWRHLIQQSMYIFIQLL